MPSGTKLAMNVRSKFQATPPWVPGASRTRAHPRQPTGLPRPRDRSPAWRRPGRPPQRSPGQKPRCGPPLHQAGRRCAGQRSHASDQVQRRRGPRDRRNQRSPAPRRPPARRSPARLSRQSESRHQDRRPPTGRHPDVPWRGQPAAPGRFRGPTPPRRLRAPSAPGAPSQTGWTSASVPSLRAKPARPVATSQATAAAGTPTRQRAPRTSSRGRAAVGGSAFTASAPSSRHQYRPAPDLAVMQVLSAWLASLRRYSLVAR